MKIKTTWLHREVLRVTWLVIGPICCVAWLIMGFCSLNRLGHVLERTGRNLQEYDY